MPKLNHDGRITEAITLLRRGVSQREVSKALGMGRGYVSDIFNGRVKPSPIVEPEIILPGDGEYKRCPGCGAMALMPCLACQLEELKAELKKNPIKDCT